MTRRVRFCTVTLLALTACGRKATKEDCELIVDRNVEVRLKADGEGDPERIRKRKEELREQLRGDIDLCVGKRVTDGMMACVKSAEKPDQIDKCLR